VANTKITAANIDSTSTGITLADLTVNGDITGTLATAAQTNITSVGTLTGLGVNSGAAHLNVSFATSNAAGYDSILSLTAGAAGGVSVLNLGYDGDTDYSRIYRSGTDLIFDNNNAERMRIDSSGTVKMSVNGSVASLILENDADKPYMSFTESGSAKFFIGESSGVGGGDGFYDLYAASGLGQRFFTGAAERMRIDSVGEVSIKRAGSGGSGVLKALNLNHAGTSVNDGAKISFTAGESSEGAGIASTGQAFNSADLRFYAGGDTERMRIDSSGNVGIGETNPTKLGLTGSSTGKVLALGGDDCQLRLTYTVLHHDHSGNTTTHLRNHYGSLDALARMKLESGYISFHTGTAFTEGMRVDSGGRLLINQTSSNLTYGKLQVSAGGETAGHGGIVGFFDTDVSVGTSNLIQRLMFTGDPDATGGVFIRFSDSNSTLGQITAANGTQCSYGVSSDERLKENIVDASSQLDLINNIRVREFDWKVNGYHEVGMIAQELNTVVPSVVQEGGDDITEQPWTVDYGKLTPYLIKAIQEQQTIIDDLKSRIEALEG